MHILQLIKVLKYVPEKYSENYKHKITAMTCTTMTTQVLQFRRLKHLTLRLKFEAVLKVGYFF